MALPPFALPEPEADESLFHENSEATGMEFTEDGGVIITDETAPPPEPEIPEHYDNLVDALDAQMLMRLGQELFEAVEADDESRREWFERYQDGLKSIAPEQPDHANRADRGLSSVHHPLIIESATQFQGRVIGELFPPDGPVQTRVIGESDDEREEQSIRVRDYMNYQLMEEMEEYFPDLDQMVFHLPLAGMTFKKAWYDPTLSRVTSQFVTAEKFIAHYATKSLSTSPRYTHVVEYTKEEYEAYVAEGFYTELKSPESQATPTHTSTENEIEGVSTSTEPDEYLVELYEVHVMRAIEGDRVSPYIVTLDKHTQQVVRVCRNWKLDDDKKRKRRVYFVPYKFLPGLGFYGWGLYHAIGGLGSAATGALRALLDSAAFANLQGGLKLKGSKAAGEINIAPGEFADVDSAVDDITKAVMPLPFKEPSQALFNLLGFIVDAGKGFTNVAEFSADAASSGMPVGTTLALIEQGSKVFSAIHKRLHNSQKLEFRLIADLNSEFMPQEYPYDVEGASRKIFAKDFDKRVDVVPVSDPNIYSNSQRIAQAQAMLDLARQAPELHDLHTAYERMYQAMRIPGYRDILLDPLDVPRLDPVSENMSITMGKPVQVFQDQDHTAHIIILDRWFASLPPDMMPMFQPRYAAHRAEHMAYLYRAQVQAMLKAPLPAVPDDLNDRSEHLDEVNPQLDAQISEAVAIMLENSPPNPLGPPPPQPPQQGPAQADPAVVAAAEAQAIQLTSQAKVAAMQAEAQLKLQIEQAKAQSDLMIRQTEARANLEIKMVEAQIKAGADMQKLQAQIEAIRVKTEADIQSQQTKLQAALQAKAVDKALNVAERAHQLELDLASPRTAGNA